VRDSRQAVGIGLAVVVLLAGVVASRWVHVFGTTVANERLSTASPLAPAPDPSFHVPAAGESFVSGSITSTPCPDGATKPVARTLFQAGPVTDPDLARPVLRVRSGGLLDLGSGHLNLVGGEYLASSEAGKPLAVTPGVYPVTIAEEWDETWGEKVGGHWAAAAEIRLSDHTPVRWQVVDVGVTDGGSLAWFDPAARVRVRAAGYDAVADRMDYYKVTGTWNSPCSFVDVRTGKAAHGHDALLLEVGADGGYPMVVGYDADGAPADVVALGNASWSVLGLPGTPPPDDSDSASPVPVPAPPSQR
jgi:hypothetical protein